MSAQWGVIASMYPWEEKSTALLIPVVHLLCVFGVHTRKSCENVVNLAQTNMQKDSWLTEAYSTALGRSGLCHPNKKIWILFQPRWLMITMSSAVVEEKRVFPERRNMQIW